MLLTSNVTYLQGLRRKVMKDIKPPTLVNEMLISKAREVPLVPLNQDRRKSLPPFLETSWVSS